MKKAVTFDNGHLTFTFSRDGGLLIYNCGAEEVTFLYSEEVKILKKFLEERI